MKRFFIIISVMTAFVLVAVIPVIALAKLIQGSVFINPLGKNTDLTQLIQSVINQLFPLAITVCAIIIIWKGFQYVIASSTGNEGKMKEIKNSFFWLLIYIAVLAGAKTIIQAVKIFGEGI